MWVTGSDACSFDPSQCKNNRGRNRRSGVPTTMSEGWNPNGHYMRMLMKSVRSRLHSTLLKSEGDVLHRRSLWRNSTSTVDTYLCSPMVEATDSDSVRRRFDPSHRYQGMMERGRQ